MSAPDRERRHGPRPRHVRRCKHFTLLDANGALRELALDLARDSTRLREIDYQRGDARAALANAEPPTSWSRANDRRDRTRPSNGRWPS